MAKFNVMKYLKKHQKVLMVVGLVLLALLVYKHITSCGCYNVEGIDQGGGNPESTPSAPTTESTPSAPTPESTPESTPSAPTTESTPESTPGTRTPVNISKLFKNRPEGCPCGTDAYPIYSIEDMIPCLTQNPICTSSGSDK